MLFSILYLILGGMLRLVPAAEGGREREVEILVLRHQLKVLSRKAGRPRLRRTDRAFLAAVSRMLPRERWTSFLVRPSPGGPTTVRSHLRAELVRSLFSSRDAQLDVVCPRGASSADDSLFGGNAVPWTGASSGPGLRIWEYAGCFTERL